MSESQAVDKQQLYGVFQAADDGRRKLGLKAAHKALDLAEDMGDITSTNTTKSGIGWRELAVLGAAGLGGAYMLQDGDAPPQLPPAPPAAVAPAALTDSDYVVRFWQQQPDGKYKLVEVPRLPPSERAKAQ